MVNCNIFIFVHQSHKKQRLNVLPMFNKKSKNEKNCQFATEWEMYKVWRDRQTDWKRTNDNLFYFSFERSVVVDSTKVASATNEVLHKVIRYILPCTWSMLEKRKQWIGWWCW
jgi:hypothetical protein